MREQFESFAAHVIQHEIDHLRGIVFLQTIVDELTAQQKAQVLQAIDHALSILSKNALPHNQTERILVFDREDTALILHDQKLLPALLTHSRETLLGLKNCCMGVT